MQLVLFNNGQGVARCESAEIRDGVLHISVSGAPAFSILTIITKTHSIRRHLNANNTCELELSSLENGDISFTVSTKGKSWHCAGIKVERDEHGNCYIYSLANYAEMLEKCFAEISDLRETVMKIRDEMLKVRNLGRKSFDEVVLKLSSLGLALAPAEE